MENRERKINIIFNQFDQIIAEHMERLLGTRLDIGGLPLNLVTISCLIFLAEQNADERDNFTTPHDRYTCETLFKELGEIGFERELILKKTVEDMCQKEYIQIDEMGLISVKKPLLDMARLLERIFPKMPGLNFVAYIAQTVDETISGRKEIDHAMSQFHQTLLLQGTPIKESGNQRGKQQRFLDKPIIQTQESTSFHHNYHKSSSKGNIVSTGDYKRIYQTDTPKDNSPASSGFKVLSSSCEFDQADIQEVNFGNTALDQLKSEHPFQKGYNQTDYETLPNSDRDKTSDEVEGSDSEIKAVTQDFVFESKYNQELDSNAQRIDVSNKSIPSAEFSEKPPLNQEKDSTACLNEMPESNVIPPVTIKRNIQVNPIEHESAIAVEAQPSDNTDDIIEKQIAEFEEALAMQCPLCKTGQVIENRTMKGKAYYKCPNKSCTFICWGKPHHLICPKCNNPFLVENEKNGKTVLKCPRSTCRYWQSNLYGNIKESQNDSNSASCSAVKKVAASKPRRRVVKRRVVRKKK